MNTVGYHTVEDRDNPDFVEEKGPFVAMGSLAFLGVGYYFWEESLELAHWWGGVHCSGEYMICRANLGSPDEVYLDLVGNVRDMNYLKKLKKELASELVRKFGTSDVPMGKLIEHLYQVNLRPGRKGIFPYKVIRTVDTSKKSKDVVYFVDKKENVTDLSPRIIICLKEKNSVFLRDFRIVFPEKYVTD